VRVRRGRLDRGVIGRRIADGDPPVVWPGVQLELAGRRPCRQPQPPRQPLKLEPNGGEQFKRRPLAPREQMHTRVRVTETEHIRVVGAGDRRLAKLARLYGIPAAGRFAARADGVREARLVFDTLPALAREANRRT
jgi:hypothetical protein